MLKMLIRYLEDQKRSARGNVVTVTVKKVRSYAGFRRLNPQMMGRVLDFYLTLLEVHGYCRSERRARHKIYYFKKDDLDDAILYLKRYLGEG